MMPLCCCEPVPDTLEEKSFALLVRFPGVTRWAFLDDGGAGTYINDPAWSTRRYLKVDVVETDPFGKLHTTFQYFDPDSGTYSQGEYYDPEFYFLYFPIGRSMSATDTVFTEIISEVGVPDRTIVRTLSEPLELSDFLATWRIRFEALMPTGDLCAAGSVTARAGGNNPQDYTDRAGNFTVPFAFAAAAVPDSVSRVWLQPWRGPAGYLDNAVYPWDETLEFFFASAAANQAPLGYSPLSADPMPTTTHADETVIPTWDAALAAFTYPVAPVEFIFLKTCQALPHGLNCEVTAYDALTNYRLGDVVLLTLDYATGHYTRAGAHIAYPPGYQVFAGPGSPIGGQGWCRRQVTGDGTSDIRMIPDYCPP